MNLSELNRDFGRNKAQKIHWPQDPILLIETWLQQAMALNIHEANAMVVSTVGPENRPSSRVVLLKEFAADTGFIFYTDYESRKGRELALHPYASLHFFWREMERQIRIEGKVENISRELSIAYFDSRPIESRASAMVSKQSTVIDSLDSLLKQRDQLLQQPQKINCPERWGGYTLKAEQIEFWQGGNNRLHERTTYQLVNGIWHKTFLAP